MEEILNEQLWQQEVEGFGLEDKVEEEGRADFDNYEFNFGGDDNGEASESPNRDGAHVIDREEEDLRNGEEEAMQFDLCPVPGMTPGGPPGEDEAERRITDKQIADLGIELKDL